MKEVLRVNVVLLVLGLGCLAGAGCAVRPVPCAETVEGTLTSGNTPLAGVRVQFVPQVGQGVKAPISSATTDEKGFFSLKRDDNGQPGAALGKHKVVLLAGRAGGARSRDDNDQNAAGGVQIPPLYISVTTTPLEVEVKADQKTYPLQVP
jgi:hypothetical protein